MKKIIPIIMLAVLALTGCQNQNSFAGKYSGTFTFVTNNVTKDGSVRFVSNPLTGSLLMYGLFPLTPVSGNSNVYMSNENNTELITQLLQYIGNQNNVYNTATEQIKNVKVEATFSGNQVNIDMYYEILILELMTTRISIVKFSGTK